MKFSIYNLEIRDKDSGRLILFNTLTGNSFFITHEISQAIKDCDIEKLDKETKEAFWKCGMIVDDKVDEKRYFTYYHNKTKYSTDHVSSTVLLTWACNFACVYCYEGAGEKVETMDHESAIKYVKFMKNHAEARRVKSMHINLFGGEPLMNIKEGIFVLDELLKYCTEKNIVFSCSVVTNGTLLTNSVIETLLKYNCTMVQVTLDGMRETHDARRPYKGGRSSFDDVIAAIERLSEYPMINTVVRINIDKKNLLETDSLIKYIGKDGLNLTKCSLDFGIVRGTTKSCSAYSGNCIADSEIGETVAQLWNIAENNGFKIYSRPSLRWMYCGLYGDNQFTITPDCGIYKCWEHAGLDAHKMGEIGLNGEFQNIRYAFFDWMSKNPLEDSECNSCVYLPACGGGCGVISYNETKSYHAKGCFKVKGVLEKQVLRYVDQLTKQQNC